ncbi:MAG TPA: TetR/AcrR family transcriptional regulator, partial [candidate division Zixibacteria bacterium]|nr:TetR/AcrR family transcriptional regulator [candidate division Zixibacteria bacterium]
YHSAKVRDIVAVADVAVGTFYFYFPDKETLFVHLYEETAEFLLRALEQAVRGRATLQKKIKAAVQAYVNIGVYEPAVVHLLLVGGIGAVPALIDRRARFRKSLVNLWQEPLDEALEKGLILPQNTRLSAEALSGAIDEVVLHLLDRPDPKQEASAVVDELTELSLRAVAFVGI